jgi:hypothetical protein
MYLLTTEADLGLCGLKENLQVSVGIGKTRG